MLGVFQRCYELVPNGFSAPTWHLVALPDAGAMADQDAWTMEALGFARDVMNRLASDMVAATQPHQQPQPSEDYARDDDDG